MKDGFITAMLLGFFLLAGIITFGGTVADDIVVHNKIQNLKKLTDHSALAAAKHYVINDDTTAAETMVRNMLDKTELGLEVRDSITFEWDLVSDPRTVKTNITDYSQATFWYKFLKKDSFILDAESMANIIGEVFKPTTDELTPLGINKCGRPDSDFDYDTLLTFDFMISPQYGDSDLDHMYPIAGDCESPAGNSQFAHWKNLFNNDGTIDTGSFDVDNPSDGCFVDTSSITKPFQVDPNQFFNSIKHFDFPFQMDILVLDCGTTYSDDNVTDPGELIVSEILTIRINSLPTIANGTFNGVNGKILTFETTVGGFEDVVLDY